MFSKEISALKVGVSVQCDVCSLLFQTFHLSFRRKLCSFVLCMFCNFTSDPAL